MKALVGLFVSVILAAGCGKGIESKPSGNDDKKKADKPAATGPSKPADKKATTGTTPSKTTSLTLGSWSTLKAELPREYKTAPTATLLKDGRVLVWGHEAAAKGTILDVAKDAFTDAPDGRFPRREHAALGLKDGKVLLIGGANVPKNFYVMRSVAVFDPAANTIDKSESMASQRRGHSAHLGGDGKIYVIGGMAGGLVPPTRNIDMYDPATKKWSIVGKLLVARFGHRTADLGNNRILVVGGHDRDNPVKTLEVCTLGAKTTCKGLPLGSKREKPAVATLGGGKALVVGGQKIRGADEAIVFDAEAFTFKSVARPKSKRSGHAAVQVGEGRVLVVGGAEGGSGEAEIYDAATDKWYECGRPSAKRFDGAAVKLADGRVLHVGGADAGGKPVTKVDVWTP